MSIRFQAAPKTPRGLFCASCGIRPVGIRAALGSHRSILWVCPLCSVTHPTFVRLSPGAHGGNNGTEAGTFFPEGVSFAEASTLPMNGLTALRALELAALVKGQILAVSGGAGLLAHYAIAAAKWNGLKVIADAKPAEAELVRSYGADIVVERGPGFAEAIRRELPNGVDALLDTAVLAAKSFGAIRDGGIYIPVRGWGDKPSERGIEIKPVFVYEVFGRTEWLELLRDMVAAGQLKLRVAGEYAPEQTADAQRALEAGGLRGRPVILF